MTVMLDTNICIYLIKQQPPTIVDRLEQYPVGEIVISTVTVAELEYGVSKSRHGARNRQALDQFLHPFHIVTFDREAAKTYGHVRLSLEKRGQRIGAMDLLIAAQALSSDATLVTNNEKEFRRVPGLRVENWVS